LRRHIVTSPMTHISGMKRLFVIFLLQGFILFSSFGFSLAYAAEANLTREMKVKSAKVKAGLVYHLSELTQWPDRIFEQDTNHLTVGVLGEDPYGFADYFRSQSVNFTAQGRSFVVRKLSFQIVGKGKYEMAPALKKSMRECNILFVTAAETRHLAQILGAIGESGVLTVGETEAFSTAGGMVSFVIDKSTVKIYVNLLALNEGRIYIGSEFLRHVQIVEGK
jgi:hypothetical protein